MASTFDLYILRASNEPTLLRGVTHRLMKAAGPFDSVSALRFVETTAESKGLVPLEVRRTDGDEDRDAKKTTRIEAHAREGGVGA
jgi:hypothetical protein